MSFKEWLNGSKASNVTVDDNLPYTEFIVTLVGNNVSVSQSDQGGTIWVNDESASILKEHLAKREQVVNALNELVTPIVEKEAIEIVQNDIQQGLDVIYPLKKQSKPKGGANGAT